MTTDSPSRELPTTHATTVQLLCFILLTVLTLITLPSTLWEGLLLAALAALCFLAALLRFGWLVPCIVIGYFFGLIYLDAVVKGGDEVSQMEETVNNVVIGTTLGLLAGVAGEVWGYWRRNHGAEHTGAVQSENQQP